MLFKYYFILFTSLWVISYFAYPFASFIQVDERTVNFGLYSLILILNLVFLVLNFVFKNRLIRITKPSITFIIVGLIFGIQFLASLFQNSVIEWLPTCNRYLLYISTFIIFYSRYNQLNIKKTQISGIVYIISIILIVSAIIEMVTGNVRFINGAYRVSGNFMHHHLGFALSTYVVANYLIYLAPKKYMVINIILSISVLVLLILSHTRLLLIAFVITNFFIHIQLIKNLIKKMGASVIAYLLIAILIIGILNTDFFPRTKELFLLNSIDPSTLYRFYIIDQSISHLNFLEFIYGIGMGGFNDYFYKITGDNEVAAHNDYLLMLVEGGILCLVFYVFYHLKVFFDLIKKRTYIDKNIVRATFVLFVGVEIIGFLENPHYFYQSEILVFIILAYFYSSKKNNSLKTMGIKKA